MVGLVDSDEVWNKLETLNCQVSIRLLSGCWISVTCEFDMVSFKRYTVFLVLS